MTTFAKKVSTEESAFSYKRAFKFRTRSFELVDFSNVGIDTKFERFVSVQTEADFFLTFTCLVFSLLDLFNCLVGSLSMIVLTPAVLSL